VYRPRSDRHGGAIEQDTTPKDTPAQRRAGAAPRRKGDRIERDLIKRHRAMGVHAERYPFSGASLFRGKSHDIDVYLFGRDETPIMGEVKSRKSGAGFATLERWLAEYGALFLRRNNADPLVLLPWRVWARILETARR
jgi:Holliday junction resolvase